ncbi:MAG: PTS ascorbate transporter subunit IIB, partial [Erysipelotrichaceae bacterium]|nr:PTS ascorbate transporter subunit IIB [Erysipelotrichaceae bacterium]
MAKINKIMCCCGSGLGSSLMVQMNIQKALKNLGIEGV